MGSKQQEKKSQTLYFLFKGFVLIEFGFVIGASIDMIRGPILATLLGYGEKTWLFGVFVTFFLYAIPCLTFATLANLFYFFWKQGAACKPQLRKIAYNSISIFIVALTLLFTYICKSIFFSPMSQKQFNILIIFIPIIAIVSICIFSYTFIKTHRN